MLIDYSKMYTALTSVSDGVEVWRNEIPEGKDLPGVAYINQSNEVSRRLDDSIIGVKSEWLIFVLAKSASEAESIAKRFSVLDGDRATFKFMRVGIAEQVETQPTQNYEAYSLTIETID